MSLFNKNGIFTTQNQQSFIIIMKKIRIILIVLFTIPLGLMGSERLVISTWLKTGPMELKFPVFHDTENVEGKTFSATNLLTFEHLSLEDYYPREGMDIAWLKGNTHTWEKDQSNENGYLLIDELKVPDNPEAAYMAAYLQTERWMESKLEIKSPYLLEVYLNGEKIATKATIEKEENTMGTITHDIKLPRGNHLLMIKTLRLPEEGLEWKVMANLEIKDPYLISDLKPGLTPQTTKDILHVMDGKKISRVDPSPDGRFYAINYRRSLPPSNDSETWTEIKSFSDKRVIESFRHSRTSRHSWLPKTNAVSYTTTRNGKTTLHLHHMENGQKSILMEGIENFQGYRWSPDEKSVFYLIREEGSGADDTMRQIKGMQDRLPGWRNRTFLYQLDVNSGIKTRLTYGNISTSLQDVSPDGEKLVFSQSRPDYLERPYHKHDLFILNIQSMEVDTLLADQRWGVSVQFSPDGKKLLATGGPSAFNRACENLPEGTIANNYDTQAYIFDLEDRSVKCITLDFKPSVSSAHWQSTDNHIYLLVTEKDFRRLYKYNTRRERFTMVDTGVEFASTAHFAGSANTATYLGNQANAPQKAYVMDLRRERYSVLEDTEGYNYRHVEFGEVKNWNFTTSTGLEINGRYYLPPDFDPDEKYPLIVYYYGGMSPVSRAFGGRYPFNIWAGHGYVVYVLQPSGAIGFGQEFSAAHVNNWGITVADEIIEGTEKFLEAHPFADPERIGCGGASYGGFMTMLLMTRTDMFTAAFSHAGISNIASYWGEGYWGYSYSAEASAGSFPWNSPEIYVDQSPLFHADKVTTPLLLLTGDSDTNVPPGESIQMYTALKLLGRPVELILVEGEDHHILTYNKRIKWHHTIMAWWAKYLQDQPEWWNDLYPEKNY